MREVTPKPVHASYQRHRRQRTTQIILPMVLAVILCIAAATLVGFATFQWNGDVGRWAAISTMWIAIPVFLMGLVFLTLLVGLIYLLARLLGIAPTYTSQAQNFVQKLGIRIRLAANALVKPVIYVNGMGSSIKALFGRK